MKPVVIIVGRAGNTQQDYDNLMRLSKPHNITEFWAAHLPKNTPLLVTQWNLGIFADGKGHMAVNIAAIGALIAKTFGAATPVKIVGHSFGGGTGINVQVPRGSEFFGVDPVDPELFGASEPSFILPRWFSKATCWARTPVHEVPWSGMIKGISAGSPVAQVTNILFPFLPGESINNAHGRKMWAMDVINAVAA